MEIYKCYVPRKDYSRAKDYSTLILNKLRKRDLNVTPCKIQRQIAKTVRDRFHANYGAIPLVDILKEYYEEIKKEDH